MKMANNAHRVFTFWDNWAIEDPYLVFSLGERNGISKICLLGKGKTAHLYTHQDKEWVMNAIRELIKNESGDIKIERYLDGCFVPREWYEEESTTDTNPRPDMNSLELSRLGTQGRKGKKLQRYNLGLTTANKEFIQIVARGTGQTQNGLINAIIDKYRREHPDLIDKTRDVLEILERQRI